MPVRITTPDRDFPLLVEAWPHQSMTPRGFVWFMGATSALFAFPLIAVIGTPVLWVILVFILAALGILWMAINRNQRDASIVEILTIWPDRVSIVRHNPRGPDQCWEANPQWVRLHLHPESGPVPNYLTLTGGGREVEFGAFLSAEERLDLHRDLSRHLG